VLDDALEPTHLLVVLAVVLLVFGGKKLPELARGLGQGVRIFRAELRAPADEVAPRSPASLPTPENDQSDRSHTEA
jgi:sec-independent protein translocase protein TatA